ncbi:uncharacterized protein B0H18DRAFT_280038 [Fomitopsis serialis]|uniref:uncharacterized protein n=1 Tax=Fomitopsis serialis TaxID=139415 RepID=UPI0020076E41|nr:uncharacterized protein B0H18DRAFT_280038 [Neoantrodia serialis]KAH9927586.1 hypothetical protein B0H18DRAFT_280038 [Neoantrodia serialis]
MELHIAYPLGEDVNRYHSLSIDVSEVQSKRRSEFCIRPPVLVGRHTDPPLLEATFSHHRCPMLSTRSSRQHLRCRRLAAAQHPILSSTTLFLFNAIAPFAPVPHHSVHNRSVCVCFAYIPGALPIHEEELELLPVRSDRPGIERDLRNGSRAMPSRGVTVQSRYHAKTSSTSYSNKQLTGTATARKATRDGVKKLARQRREFKDVIHASHGQYVRIPETTTDHNA